MLDNQRIGIQNSHYSSKGGKLFMPYRIFTLTHFIYYFYLICKDTLFFELLTLNLIFSAKIQLHYDKPCRNKKISISTQYCSDIKNSLKNIYINNIYFRKIIFFMTIVIQIVNNFDCHCNTALAHLLAKKRIV